MKNSSSHVVFGWVGASWITWKPAWYWVLYYLSSFSSLECWEGHSYLKNSVLLAQYLNGWHTVYASTWRYLRREFFYPQLPELFSSASSPVTGPEGDCQRLRRASFDSARCARCTAQSGRYILWFADAAEVEYPRSVAIPLVADPKQKIRNTRNGLYSSKQTLCLPASNRKYKLPFSSTIRVDFPLGCLLEPPQKPRWLAFLPHQRVGAADHEFHAPFYNINKCLL